jgi:hypothetical protein
MSYKVCLPRCQYEKVALGIQTAIILYDQNFKADDIINVYNADDDSAPAIKTVIRDVTFDNDIVECSVMVSIELYDGSDSEKHWSECRLISEYETEIAELKNRIIGMYNNSSENFSNLINFLD